MRVAIVGLGRIGLPMAALCANRGHDVVAIDRDPAVLGAVRSRALPYDEPGMELDRLRLADDVDGVEAEVWIVCVGTSDRDALTAAPVEAAVEAIAARGGRFVIIESTVPPGTTSRLAERFGITIAHCPERARPGQVLRDIAAMPRLLGGADTVATERATAFYRTLTTAELHACTAEEAELAKLAENAEREVRIAFANELADVAERLGVDAERVIELANSHPRAAVLRPGVGVGGHCLPMATDWFARRGDGVCGAARALHQRRPAEVASRVAATLPTGARVCVLGRTYRPDTRYDQPADGSDRYASPAVALIDELRERGLNVTSWDPIDGEARKQAALEGARVVLHAHPGSH